MAGKGGFKSILLKKGDKIALIGCIVLAVLFMAMGLMSMASAPSPDVMAKDFKQEDSRIRTGLEQEGDSADPLPDWLLSTKPPPALDSEVFALTGVPFEPVHKPDRKKEMPNVVTINDGQIMVVRGPLESLDIIRGNTPATSVIGVLKNVVRKVNNAQGAAQELMANLSSKARAPQPNVPQPGMMPGSEGGYDIGGGGLDQTRRTADVTVDYIPVADFGKKAYEPAKTIRAVRMLVVNALFPIEEQREENRRALRMPNPRSMTATTGNPLTGNPLTSPMDPEMSSSTSSGMSNVDPYAQPGTAGYTPVEPYFDGVSVQRRIKYPGDAEFQEWADFDAGSVYYSDIKPFRLGDDADNPYFLPFMRYGQKLVAPLPKLIEGLGDYPRITMPAFVESVQELEKWYNPVDTSLSELQKQLGGLNADENPYAPVSPNLLGTIDPEFSGESGFPGGQGPGMMPPGGPGQPMPGGQVGPNGAPLQTGKIPSINQLLIRFIDPTVQPGYTYEYRVSMKMRNPVYDQNADQPGMDKILERRLSIPSQARQKFIQGPYKTVGEPMTVPPETYLYAYDPEAYLDDTKEMIDNSGRSGTLRSFLQTEDVRRGDMVTVQMQAWLEKTLVGSNVEPIGTWVIANMPVSVGDYIGRRQIIPLPLWSSGAQSFVLRKLSGSSKVAGLDEARQPKGWPVNFRTESVLVDFEGGAIEKRFTDRSVNPIRDRALPELLIRQPDGKFLVRRASQDMVDPSRVERDEAWKKWTKSVKEQPDPATQPMPGEEGGTGFERGS